MLGKRHASLSIVLGIDVTGVRVERDLGIDDQVLALRQVNDHIGALAIDFTGEADLPLEVLAVDQAGALQDILQNQLAPIALRLLLPFQRCSEVLSLLGDLSIQLL
ncbi:hypothetical protein D9M70_506400 [compost metagenome]